ncbi:MAG: aspartate aminotransferase family protein, partial [Gemmatimonadales bacterium]
AIRELGRTGIAKIIEQTCRHAHELVARIGKLPGAEVLWAPRINQGLVRFLDERPGATNADHDRRTDEVTAAIRDTGEAFFYGTTWRGKRCMRVSVSSCRTTGKDIDRTVAAVQACLTAASRSPVAPSHAP